MAANEADSNYPNLSWQDFAAKNLSQRLGAVEEWWTERIDVAQYARIPLGNLGFDVSNDIADVFFARKLEAENHLLWVSDTCHADLGGGASEANVLLVEELTNPELTAPGAYRCICVEMQINGMAVNALIKMASLDSIDGIELGTLLDASIESRLAQQAEEHTKQQLVPSVSAENERAACGHTLRILKTLVQGWMGDLARTDNEYADLLLQHFYRWLRNPASQLHDGALHRVVHSLMRRLFVQLVTELRGLGCEIVYADFNSVIISTGKVLTEQAEGYMAYIFDTLKSNEIFDFVDFEISRSWQSLLFMDKANHGGVDTASEAPPAVAAEMVEGKQPPPAAPSGADMSISSNWHLAEYLPTEVQNDFLTLVSQFIYMHFKGDSDAPPTEAEEGGYMAPISLQEHFTPKLLTVVEAMKLGAYDSARASSRKDGDPMEEDDADAAPDTAIELAPMRKTDPQEPALEFVIFFCKILSLDRRLEHETMLLRRNLLKMLQVREFNQEACFENPCLTFILPDVICSFCNFNKDLDLCRDPDLLNHNWSCSSCSQPYNRAQIESTLVEIAQTRTTRYQLQDLRCSKCNLIKPDNLSAVCACAGNYVCTESAEELQQALRTLHQIADYHDFNWLLEVCEWLLDMEPMQEQEAVEEIAAY